MPGWEGPGFVDAHTHLLQVAAGAIRLGSDRYTPHRIRHEAGAADVTAAFHRRVAAAGSTPMDEPPRPVRAFDLPGALEAGLRAAADLGLVEVTEAGMTDWSYWDALRDLRQRGDLPCRVRILVASGVADLGRMVRTGDAWLEIAGVKFYADGWLVPRTCALSRPFADTGDHGVLFLDPETLARRAAPYAEAGWTIATHAIGDRAIESVLDAYDLVWGGDGAAIRAAGPRIEHAQVLRPDLISRMAEAGVVACIQPSFAVADAAHAAECLGPGADHAYRWNELLAAGVTTIAGSDFPIETLSPLWGLRRLVTGADVGADPVTDPLPFDAALRMMTDPAKGSVVLDADPAAVEPDLLHLLRVVEARPAGHAVVASTP
jgi:predicted amidohydrolase YtcJ